MTFGRYGFNDEVFNSTGSSAPVNYDESASVAIGIGVAASRASGVIRSAAVAVGVGVTASRSYATERIASVIYGVSTTASRLLSITRTAIVQIGTEVDMGWSWGDVLLLLRPFANPVYHVRDGLYPVFKLRTYSKAVKKVKDALYMGRRKWL